MPAEPLRSPRPRARTPVSRHTMSFPLEGRPKIPDPGYVNLLNVPRALTGCMGASQKKRTGFIENRPRKNDRNQRTEHKVQPGR